MVHSLADITGTGVAVALAAGPPSKNTKANWIQFTVPSNAAGSAGTNSAAVRVGDSLVSATRGTQVPLNGMMFPPISDGVYMDLTLIYAFIATNDKLQVTYGVL